MDKYYLGIDVSKGYADFCLLSQKKEQVEESFQLDDTFVGHNKLFTLLVDFINRRSHVAIFSAVESTGGYEDNWYKMLRNLPESMKIQVTRLNPIVINHSSKSNMNRVTTDKISSRVIAEYLIEKQDRVRYQETDEFSPLKRNWSHVKLLTKQMTQLSNQLQSMLYISNPEILFKCKDGIPRYILHLLKKYPTAKLLSLAKEEELRKIPYFPRALVGTFIKNAKSSVFSKSDKFTENIIRSLADQIMNLELVIDKHCELMEENFDSAEVKLLTSFKGIGVYSAVGLLIEIGGIERFETSKQLAAYFGLHPVYKESGDGKKGMHMSKKGRIVPRALLYMIVLSSILHNSHIRQLYKKHLSKGMCRKAAIGVLMHKVLRIVYGMLKNKTSYNPEIDKNNSEKIIIKKEKKVKTKVRRLMDYSSEAPISRRQNKKRKEQMTSQNE